MSAAMAGGKAGPSPERSAMKRAPVFPRSAVPKCRRLLLVLALVVTALVVAGCRSDDSNPGNGKSPTQTVAPGY